MIHNNIKNDRVSIRKLDSSNNCYVNNLVVRIDATTGVMQK